MKRKTSRKKSKLGLVINLILVISIITGTFALLANLGTLSGDKKSSAPKGKWVLVTDQSMLQENSKIIFVSRDRKFAMGKQADGYREAVAVVASGDTITINKDVQIITLKKSLNDDAIFQFYVDDYFSSRLYCPSGSSNSLKTTSVHEYDDIHCYSWGYSISTEKTEIFGYYKLEDNDNSYLKLLKYNPSFKRFSCYQEGSTMQDVLIYTYVEE